MAGQSPPVEHVYLAPSLTRTPTPPLLIDKSKEALSMSQSGTVHRTSIDASSASEDAISEASPSDSVQQEAPNHIDLDPQEIVSQLKWDEPIPTDKTTVSGVQSSGMTYYVKANCVPMDRVHLRLVVRVGSVNEQPHERGFAHLIEHLLFRHTESFKDNEIQRFLSSVGAKPGADSNATTYHDYTVFNLMIPVDERTIDFGFSDVDMGVKVLAEMALRAHFTERILEQERRIVLEECRLNQTNIAKRNALASKIALSNTPYADKAPIGDLEMLKSCRIEHLIEFYHKWYQPSNMAVIAVGGFQDPKIIIDLIDRHFSEATLPPHVTKETAKFDVRNILHDFDLPSIPPSLFAQDAAERALRLSVSQERFPSPVASRRISVDSSESPPRAPSKRPTFFITRNRDDSQSHVVLMFRYVEQPNVGSLEELKSNLTIRVLSWLLNNRANLLVNAYLGRLMDLVASESRITSTIRVFEIGFSCASGCELETLGRVITEIERLKRFLIADEDMEQIKILSHELCEREVHLKESGVSSEFSADKIVKHYLYNEPLEDTTWSPHLMARVIASWTTSDFQLAAQKLLDVASSVLFVSLSGPETTSSQRLAANGKQGSHHREVSGSLSDGNSESVAAVVIPELTESDFTDVMKKAARMELDPIYYYKIPQIMKPEEIPDPGRIVSVTVKSPSVTVYTLENGARVQLNSVPALDQRHSLGIDLEVNAEGGLAEFWCAEGLSALHSALVSNAFAKYISLGGVPLGSSPFELGVILVSLETFLFERRARFSALPTRIETLLQLVHCMFRSHPAKWKEEFCEQELELMLEFSRVSRAPEVKLRERAIALCWQNNSLIRPLSESDLQKVSIQTAIRWFERAWSNPAEFLFQFTGNFSTPDLQQRAINLVSRYIGSIPERMEGDFSAEARAQSLIKANAKVGKTIKFRPAIRRDVIYEAEEGTAHVLLCFPIPSFKTHLDFAVAEVVTIMLESHLFQLLRSHLARVYSVSVTPVHHFGAFFPGDITIQFVCDPKLVQTLIDRVFDAIDDLQTHGPSHRLLESSRTIYRKQKEAKNTLASETDGLQSLFGSRVATRDLDLLLDNKLAKWLFGLLFPLDNYVQVVMLPESHIPPPKPSNWASPLIFGTIGALALGTLSFATFNRWKSSKPQ
jgi:predicted Zn-dependent peptidase